ncbi:spindle and kinetochore-associated protein 3 [Spea bombifrons]|uniref:spindle and kinetochore-associated protein 3 n=1 Tax=Spea bombifrons TaxID=233779 RepID=UPI002349424B|nr:spindle and kinetochore-associated protein 3 [Spea bombifrons]
MALTGSFFNRLRSLAVTLEKETEQLENVFTQDESDYVDESPMRVLHDLRSEIKVLKGDIQTTIDKKHLKDQELMAFIRVCKVLQQRTASDIQQIKNIFQQYGYTPLSSGDSEGEVSKGNLKSENEEQSSQESVDLPPSPALEKQSCSRDLLRVPQLSDFGLSHYQLPPVWFPQSTQFNPKKSAEEEKKPLFREIAPVNAPKTPKCALRMEDDFSQIVNFGICDASTNLNDDYTMALISKKVQKRERVPEEDAPDSCSSGNLKTLLATPSHLSHRTNFDSVDSPVPPVFFTPGLKVHQKDTYKTTSRVDANPLQNENDGEASEEDAMKASVSGDLKSILFTPGCRAPKSNAVNQSSPVAPTFCTPGLKVHKKEVTSGFMETAVALEPTMVNTTTTPPLPAFEANWLKIDTANHPLDITELVPRPEFSHQLYLQDAAPMVLHSDKYYENPTKIASPPKMRNHPLDTPPRPDITCTLTEDLFKYNIKPSSPPRISGYENLIWTPTRPEMTSRVTDDVSQILSQYCNNRMNTCDTAFENKPSIAAPKTNMQSKDKENRL